MASKQTTRNIALSPQLDRFIQRRIDSGRYQSASEVVRDALRLLEQREEERKAVLKDIRRKIDVGYGEAMRGEVIDANDVFAEIKKKSKAARRTNGRAR